LRNVALGATLRVLAIKGFDDVGTEDIFNGRNTAKARATLPTSAWPAAKRKMDMLNVAKTDADLRSPPANHFEKLKGDLAGLHSIRINEQYRLVFRWTAPNGDEVYIDDYHS
jgi:proteic killer suppression protein